MNTKTKLIEQYRRYCERNAVELTQDELTRLCMLPLKYLKRILAEKMQNVVA